MTLRIQRQLIGVYAAIAGLDGNDEMTKGNPPERPIRRAALGVKGVHSSAHRHQFGVRIVVLLRALVTATLSVSRACS